MLKFKRKFRRQRDTHGISYHSWSVEEGTRSWVRTTRRKKETERKIGEEKERSLYLDADRQEILLTAQRREQLCGQGRVIAGLGTLRDLP